MSDPLRLKAWERRLDGIKVQLEQLVREAGAESAPGLRFELRRAIEPIEAAIREAKAAWQ